MKIETKNRKNDVKNDVKNVAARGRAFTSIILVALVAALTFAHGAAATVQLDSTSTDPAVIGAGDEITISVNFHDDGQHWYDKVNDGNYRLETWLEPGDTVTEEFVTILDGNGDRSVGHLFYGQAWSKKFRIKVANNAPTGTYQFRLAFQYVKNGAPYGSTMYEYFTIAVQKQGIIMDLANSVTQPNEVRPGDDYVTLQTYLENSGRKDAKAVEMTLTLPEGFRAPYADDNRVWLGYIAAGEQKALTTTFSVDDTVAPGTYRFVANLTYRDVDDNGYEKSLSFPVRVREKPVLAVVSSEGSVLAGGAGELRVTVKNTGTERAENVDVRLIKESDQPFDLEARSDYVGALDPGEEGIAVFPLSARAAAAVKNHSFTVVIRAKGDSRIGDDNVYVFNDAASLAVTGKRPNILLFVGVGLLLLILIGIGVRAVIKR